MKPKYILPLVSVLALGVAHLVHPAEGSFERALTVTGPASVDVVTGSGSIVVRAGASDSIRIHAKIRSRDEDKIRRIEENPPVRQDGNVIRIGHIEDRDLRNDVSISYELDVPVETELVSKTGSGSQTIESIRGPVHASSGSGSLRIGRVGGEVTASTGSGSVTVDGVEGALNVKTGSGSIRALAVTGAISSKSGSGDVSLEQTGSGDVTVRTGSGDIEVGGVRGALEVATGSGNVDISGELAGDWDVHAASGDIDLSLPVDASFSLTAHTTSGAIDSDHPVTVVGRMNRRELEGDVRGGGPSLSIRTSSGDIRIQ